MIIKDRDIKMWSTIGARATVGIAALELAKQIDNLILPLLGFVVFTSLTMVGA